MTDIGRYRKLLFVEDNKRLEQWQKELKLSTFAEVLHVVYDSYQEKIDKQKIFDQQKELQKKLTAMGKELSTLAELSSDFFYQNQYSNDEAVMVGTDCDA